jgi:hypothetical protein
LETPLRIDLEDCRLLGEVSACESESGLYLIRMDVCEAIPAMSDLARLMSAVMSDGVLSSPRQECGCTTRAVEAEKRPGPKRKVVPADHP